MKSILLSILALNLTLSLSASAADLKINTCAVRDVYSGDSGTFIVFNQCKGDMDFTEKRLKLEHHVFERIETRTGSNTVYINSADKTFEVLAIKQTAELAKLFNKRVRIQMENANSDIISYISLAESVDLTPPNTEWKPVPPVPNASRK